MVNIDNVVLTIGEAMIVHDKITSLDPEVMLKRFALAGADRSTFLNRIMSEAEDHIRERLGLSGKWADCQKDFVLLVKAVWRGQPVPRALAKLLVEARRGLVSLDERYKAIQAPALSAHLELVYIGLVNEHIKIGTLANADKDLGYAKLEVLRHHVKFSFDPLYEVAKAA